MHWNTIFEKLITAGRTLLCDTKAFLHKVWKTVQRIGRNIFIYISICGKKIFACRDAIGYYAVLLVVLVALTTVAYDYRSKRQDRKALNSFSPPDLGLAVQTQPDPTLNPAIAQPRFILPVQGKLVESFSENALVWSTTLQMWQTHPAIDIAASAGEAVVSAADGEVVEIYSDRLYGNVITIDHGEGCVIRYSSLNTLKLVETGQHVRQGDVISAVGTCQAEAELSSHVHLEYFDDGQAKDFLLLLEESDLKNLRD